MSSTIKMVFTLSLISALAAAALSAGNIMTRDRIKAEAKAAATGAVKRIFPNCKAPSEQKVKTASGKETTVYVCSGGNVSFVYSSKYDSAISKPYGGEIKIMLGIDASGKIKGLEIISQTETPGLGANIVEASFRNQFKGLSLKSTVWKVKKDDPSGAVDGISGATISSRAVTTTVKSALEFYDSKVKSAVKIRRNHGIRVGPTGDPVAPDVSRNRIKRRSSMRLRRINGRRARRIRMQRNSVKATMSSGSSVIRGRRIKNSGAKPNTKGVKLPARKSNLVTAPKSFIRTREDIRKMIKRKRKAVAAQGGEINGRPNPPPKGDSK